jgi:ketosteroid isomerase-like protein
MRHTSQRMRLPQTPHQWMEAFARAVREVDYTAGASLVSDQIISFGTCADKAIGARALQKKQWARIWPRTRLFRFVNRGAILTVSPEGGLAFITTTWKSRLEGAKGKDGLRSGRCTILLQREGKVWKALHTHFSLNPDRYVGPREKSLNRGTARRHTRKEVCRGVS